MTTIDTERLAKLSDLVLLRGNHESIEKGACAMEAVAWLAGEPHSDAPQCACPVIANAMIRLNDRIPWDDMRTELLRPLLPRIIGTRAGRDVTVRRAYVATDMAVRVFAPIALEKRGRLDLANRLRALTEVTDRETAIRARDEAREVRKIVADAAAYADAADAAAADADAAAAYADDADAAAYAYADAAAAYADARPVQRPIYELGVKMIERMIACT